MAVRPSFDTDGHHAVADVLEGIEASPLAPAVTCLHAISDPLLLRAVLALAERGSASAPELADVVHACAATVRSRLRKLIADGVVEIDQTREPVLGRPPLRYRLTPEVRRGLVQAAGLAAAAAQVAEQK